MKNLSFCFDLSFFKGLFPYLLGLGFLGIPCNSIAVNAQTLPPPPTIRVPSKPPTPAPLPPTSTPVTTPQPVEVPVSTPTSNSAASSSVREFTFQAPSGSTPAPTSTTENNQPSVLSATTTANFYRVEVSASDGTILEKVKAIEPFAFWQQEQQIVYAGRFHQKDQAQQRVQELTQQGLSAQIVPISP
ncbi:MAG: hypothetical protein AB4041_13005 [Microcystaceae cyanobacterium]